jgi:fucose permease
VTKDVAGGHGAGERAGDAARIVAAGQGRVRATSYASFVLIGWVSLLLPSLIRLVKGDFGQTDAGFGLLYLVSAILYALGGLGSGLLHDRFGRRAILGVAALLIAIGLVAEGLAPTWPILLLAVAVVGAGAGTIDGGVNGLFMDLYPEGGGGELSGLHLFYSLGAMVAPPVVGWLVIAGADWRYVLAGTGVVALAYVVPLRAAGASADHRHHDPGGAAGREPLEPRLPLAALAVAIGCYVSSELGVSSWMVGYLSDATLGLAATALGAYWAGLAAGRLAAVRYADRFDPVVLASTCALVSGVAIGVMVVTHAGVLVVGIVAVAGLASGPVYPLIMAIGGRLYPGRAPQVSGWLTAAAVVGTIVYPPVMGFMSPVVGLGVGMAGAAVLAVVSAGSIRLAHRLAGRATATA